MRVITMNEKDILEVSQCVDECSDKLEEFAKAQVIQAEKPSYYNAKEVESKRLAYQALCVHLHGIMRQIWNV